MTSKNPTNRAFLLEQHFYWACAACCWDTVSNPGLIAMRWVQRAPLWPSVYCVNRRSHSKSKFGDREQDLTSPGVRASATSKADRDLGRAWFLFLIQGDKRGFARTVHRWLSYNRPLYLVCFVFPIKVMWWYSRELFLSNFVLFTCICTHNLWKDKGSSSPGASIGKQNTQAKEVYLKASKLH